MENILLQTKTEYNDNAYYALNRLLLKTRILLIVVACLSICGIGVALYFLDFSPIVAIVYICLGLVLPLVFLLIYKISLKKGLKQFYRMNGENPSVLFTFYEDRVEVELHSSKNNSSGFFYYTDYKKVKEDKEYFYLFINGTQAQLIDKSILNEEEIEKMKSIISKISKK